MSKSMISTVLEVEREAEEILAKAREQASAISSGAEAKRAAASKASQEACQATIADMEQKAAAERSKKARELTATGDAALAAVKNVSEAAYESGVRFVMNQLTDK